MNLAEIAQNKQEVRTFGDEIKYSCFTKLYDFDKKNGASLMTECCSKAREQDFEKLYNAPEGLNSICNLVEKTRLYDFDIDYVIKNVKHTIEEDKSG